MTGYDGAVPPVVVAVLGPTASGKSALGLALAARYGGEVISCDSTSVYRGFDIGTDKLPVEARRGIPHHLVDVADPTEVYTAARFARDAARVIREIHARGNLPILIGGTGFYYRALTRGLFPGPGADEDLRSRLNRVADRRGVERLHRMLQHVDSTSAARIMPRDRKRLVRALEIYLATGRPLTDHFRTTASLITDCDVVPLALRLPAELTAGRVALRVDEQFARGIVGEVQGLLARGVPPDARPFGGLVYRQVMEMLGGVRDEAATRALIGQENRRYARRQLIWFRKEPNLIWFDGPGERPETLTRVEDALAARGLRPRGGAA
ncbi:MAG: tRNA (adenosine(37)-N6)-dimethylallyltransferase MiaA [Acidobacteria bacterium]|nr:tRNA (adenosine(37)-N6)-dimethylallyltransferase MiaA [Acidobacteriota bacterium]